MLCFLLEDVDQLATFCILPPITFQSLNVDSLKIDFSFDFQNFNFLEFNLKVFFKSREEIGFQMKLCFMYSSFPEE